MSTSNPPIQISLNLSDDVENALPAASNAPNAVPSLWGLPLKYLSLVTLAVQNSALTIIMHYSRVSAPLSEQYSAATAVLMTELLKGTISLLIALTRIDVLATSHETIQTPHAPRRHGAQQLSARVHKLWREIFSPDCWKLSIPAILYVIQNNLQYVAVSNLDAATFQVTYQMKILTTASFSVLLLRKKLAASQWIALLLLAIGVGVVQIQAGSASRSSAFSAATSALTEGRHAMNPTKGFLAVIAACFTSGLAGVYFEMVLKNSQADLWVRNVQLSLFSLLPALAPIVFAQHASNSDTGASLVSDLFAHFGAWAWATVWVQVLGGLVTALVIKYSDNILKGFATSLSIVLSFLASVCLFDFEITVTFIAGAAIVLLATWLYNQHPARITSFTRDAWWSKNEKTNERDQDSVHSPLDSVQPHYIPLNIASRTSMSDSSISIASSSTAGSSRFSDSEARPFIH